MYKDITGPLRFTTCALVFGSFFALVSTYRYGTMTLLVPIIAIILMPIAERLDSRFPAYRTLTTGITILFTLSLPLSLQSFYLLEVVTSLVVFVQIYSLLHVKKAKNYAHILLMSFFLLLVATALSPRPIIAVAFLFFIVVGIWMMMLLDIFTGEREAKRSPILKDFPAYAATAIVDIDRINAPIVREERRFIDTRLVLYLAAISLVITFTTVVIFFLVPRTELGLLGASTQSGDFITGLSSELDLSLGGLIQTDSSAVMNVKFPNEENGRYEGPLLWRNTSFDDYDGGKWTRRGLVTKGGPWASSNERFRRFTMYLGAGSTEGVHRIPFREKRRVLQEVFLSDSPESALPALGIPQMVIPDVQFETGAIQWDALGDFTVATTKNLKPGFRYKVWSDVGRPSAEQLRASSDDYLAVMVPSDYRHLTYHDLLPETEDLVARITAGVETAFDRVAAIETYFSTGEYSYTLDVPPLPEDHPVDAFIHDTKAGHCELYASAMALMVRSIGVPTRVVNGYRGGELEESDNSYTVMNDMAHLWAEVYFPDYGWIDFDPSPPSQDLGQFSLGAFRRLISRYSLRAQMMWLRDIVGFTPKDRSEIMRNTTFKIFKALPGSGADAPGPEELTVFGQIQTMAAPTFFLVGIAAFIYFALTASRRKRRRAYPLNADQKRAVQLHAVFTRKLEALGVDCRGKTVEELREAVCSRAWAGDAGPVLEAIEVYNDSRFGAIDFPKDAYARLVRGVRRLAPQQQGDRVGAPKRHA